MKEYNILQEKCSLCVSTTLLELNNSEHQRIKRVYVLRVPSLL